MAVANAPLIDDIATLPQPTHITLLLRHHKTVTLISASPTQSLDSIKALLLSALEARNITSLRNSSDPDSPYPIPSSPSQFELGILTDRKDASKGWTLITPDLVAATSSKKKSAGKAADVDTPAGLGLVDGSWLAYRVSRDTSRDAEKPSIDASGDVVVDLDEPEDQGWDVVLPAFEDEEEDEIKDDDEELKAEAGPS
jgi:hypothetical protein